MVFDFGSLEPRIYQILSAPGTDLTTINTKGVRRQLLELDPTLTPDLLNENKNVVDEVIASVFEEVREEVNAEADEASRKIGLKSRNGRKEDDGALEGDYIADDDGGEEGPTADAELARKPSSEVDADKCLAELPSEIWHLIAQYLPRSQLAKLKWLNSFFLNYWMDHEWRRFDVQIDDFDSQKPFRFLQRLVLPFVAPRTKIVSVVLVSSGTSQEINFAGALGSLLLSLTLLPNLTSLYIHNATFHFAKFFQTITSSSLTRTLQQLFLSGRVQMFASIQKYCAFKSPFDNLTTLTLELHAVGDDDDPQLESSLTLEPFLRSLTPTLQSLMITNRSFTLDLSPLFNALSKHDSPVFFPNLTSLTLVLHFNTSFRTSPQSFRHFLRTNNHILHLRLDMTLPLPYPEDEEPLGAWLADLANDNVHFPSLQTLDIYPSDTQTGLSALLSLIKHNVPTLSSLILSSRWLKPGMANQVIGALAGCEGQPQTLKSLNLNIAELSVPFLELVARKLPQLENLCLSSFQVVGSGQNSFHDLLRKRRYNGDNTSTQDVFHAWKLRDLGIYLNSHWGDDSLDENVIRAAIPALAHLRSNEYEDDEEF